MKTGRLFRATPVALTRAPSHTARHGALTATSG
jgi:hypothetical protein